MSTTATDHSSTRDPLDRPATRRLILRLAADGYLDPAARDRALRIIRPSRAWWTWTSRLLLALGAALVVAGVVFFFAFNWAAIPPLAKLYLVQTLVALLLFGAWRLGFDSAVGKAFLLGASTAVGVLLAVFGQVYQTGADAYELFVGWAALVAGWVVISRSAAHWILWIAVVDLAVGLYWTQVLEPRDLASWETGMVVLAAINTLPLLAKEYAGDRVPWLAARWVRWTLWVSVLLFLTIPSLAFITDLPRSTQILPPCALAAGLVAGYWYFRRVRDLASITLGALSVCSVVLTAIGRSLLDGKEIALLLFGVSVLAVFSAATFWLRRLAAAMERERRRE